MHRTPKTFPGENSFRPDFNDQALLDHAGLAALLLLTHDMLLLTSQWNESFEFG
jgi:hypothetical protein